MFDPIKFARAQFPVLPAKEALEIIKSSKVLNLKAGDVFIEQGEVSYSSAFIVKGLMRAYCITNDAEEKTVLFRGEYEWIGSIPSMIKDKPANEQVVALEDTLLFLFDFRHFRSMAEKNSKISAAYSRMVEDMLSDAIDRIQDFTVLTAEQRYVKFERENRKLMQRIPLKYLASYLGIAVPSLSRIRARIAKGGN